MKYYNEENIQYTVHTVLYTCTMYIIYSVHRILYINLIEFIVQIPINYTEYF